MIVLGVDTCGVEGSLAVVRLGEGGRELVEQVALRGRRFAGALVPAIRSLLSRHELDLSDLAALVVVHGPGSYTGIRIGVSAVKGLSEAAGLPVIAVSRLQVLAEVHAFRHAALDAGRGEIYLLQGEDEWLLSREQAAERLRAPERVLVCEAALAAALPGSQLVAEPGAFEAVVCAWPRLVAQDFDDVATLDGNYVRPLAYAPTPA